MWKYESMGFQWAESVPRDDDAASSSIHPLRIRHRGILYETDVEKGKLPLPSHQLIGLSLLGVILVSPIVERSLLYFLLGTWVLQTIVIITLYPTKRA